MLAFDSLLVAGTDSDLRKAVELYGGPLLDGCDEEWAQTARDLRSFAWAANSEKLARQDIAEGKFEAAIRLLQRLIRIEPYRESAHRHLMEAHIGMGNLAEANKIFRSLDELLFHELHVSPEPETRALFESLTSHSRSTNRNSSASNPWATRQRIPRPLTAFVGRVDEISEIRSLLTENRLVTITGSGGAGKTRLAMQVAELHITAELNQCWWVDLSALTEEAAVEQETARYIGVGKASGWARRDEIINVLSAPGTLIVFDNCEHLLDAVAQIVDFITRNCAELRVLATSRQALGITGEKTYRAPPLALPSGSCDNLQSLLGFDGIRLFLDRAKEARPNHSISSSNASLTVALLRKLDAMPLAIELAASRLRTLALEEIYENLSDRFKLLSVGSRSALPRHRALSALMDWSFDLLAEPEREIFVRLAVFQGGWTLEACQCVCFPPTGTISFYAADILASLVDKSLVTKDDKSTGTRFGFLETVHAYVTDLVSKSEEVNDLKTRHLHWYVRFADQAYRHLSGASAPEWMERLEQEYANLRAAIEFALSEPTHIESALSMTGCLRAFWFARGSTLEGLSFLTRALETAPDTTNQKILVRALLSAASLAFYRGDRDVAKEHFQRVTELSLGAVDLEFANFGLNGLGMVCDLEGDYESAFDFYSRSLEFAVQLEDEVRQACALANIANAHARMGRYAKAREYLDHAKELNQRLGDNWGLAFCLHVAAWTYHRELNFQPAEEQYEESIVLCVENANKPGEREGLYELGEMHLAHGHLASSVPYLERALTLSQEMQDDQWIAIVSSRLARAYLHLNRINDAVHWILVSADRFLEDEDRENLAACLVSLSMLQIVRGDLESSAVLLGISIKLREECREAVHPHDRKIWGDLSTRIQAEFEYSDFQNAIRQGCLIASQPEWVASIRALIRDCPAHRG